MFGQLSLEIIEHIGKICIMPNFIDLYFDEKFEKGIIYYVFNKLKKEV